MKKGSRENRRATTVLVADDSKYQVWGLTKALETKGYVVIGFTNLQEAIRYYKKNEDTINLFVIDGSLQQQYDGFRWAALLHKKGHKVIICSGDRYTGAIPFFRKTRSDEEFLEFVELTLNNKL